MAKRNSGRRGRSRRRGTATAHTASTATEAPRPSSPAPTEKRVRPKRAQPAEPRGRAYRDPGSVGERPQAPWHPWPISESLILIGAIATLIGFTRGAAGRPVLFAGLGAVMLGTLEFTIREHLAGYRAHTAMLAAIPTAIAHSAAAVVLFSVGAPRTAWILIPLAFDVPLFWFLFRLLRSRFDDARRERVFQLGKR